MGSDKQQGRGTAGAKGQQKTYDVTGTNPQTGEALPPRTVTQAEWRSEKLGQQGYTKPEDLDDDTETTGESGDSSDSGSGS